MCQRLEIHCVKIYVSQSAPSTAVSKGTVGLVQVIFRAVYSRLPVHELSVHGRKLLLTNDE
jgi:hypothetical protein